jgi:uncharacterized membrane protein
MRGLEITGLLFVRQDQYFFVFFDMIRETIFKPLEHQHNQGFRMRGGEIKRIETFSDAVFAFAVTLLIVSLEVPKSFEELIVTMRGFFAFAVCFLLLMLIWYQQHLWFRRYALDDVTTVVLNAMLIFIVLFYVYPLKFVFTLWFGDGSYGTGKGHYSIKEEDIPWLMAIYGLGYTVIYLIFFFMYAHALRKKGELQLSPAEIFDTRTMIYVQLTMAGIGFCVVVLAMALPVAYSGVVGLFFFAIGPSMGLLHWRRAAIRKRQVARGQV